jgi:N utilization substance protein A
MNYEVAEVIRQISKEKGINSKVLVEAIESALISAYKKSVGAAQNAWVWVNQEEGEIELYAKKKVVEEVKDPRREISLSEARKIDSEAQLDGEVDVKITPQNFGRIAAQTAKQVIIQRVKEAERDSVYEEFKSKEGEILNGVIQRYEGGNVVVDLGRTEAMLPRSEQTPGERYNRDERIRVYVLKVEKTPKGPLVSVSRTHPDLLKKLFEMEVPEIREGIVEVRAVAREAGRRSKITVSSKSESVDPVGACVGVRGVRVQAVVRELGNERIDIVRWSPDPVVFVTNSLNPAEVTEILMDQENRRMKVVVEDKHLALAIGKGGQNVRLAAKLTGWMIDIMSVSEYEVKRQELIQEVSRTLEAAPEPPGEAPDFSMEKLPGVGKATADKLAAGGFRDIRDIASASIEQLTQVEGIGIKTANKLHEAAAAFLNERGYEENPS